MQEKARSPSPALVFLEEIKFAHSLFALPFALLATFMAAGGWPGWGPLGLIVWCMVSARTFAMTANRLIDRRIDAANPRTQGRAIASGKLTVPFAVVALLVGALALGLGCVGFWKFYNNLWPLILCLPTLAGLAFYSYLKRFTALCHLYLGLAIAFSPVAAWIAISPATLGGPAWVLMGAVACWIAGFDVIYALPDLMHDRSAGLFSLPAKLGAKGALWLSRGLHLVTIALLVTLGVIFPFGGLYWLGMAGVAGLLIYEQSLVKPNDFSRVNLAFFTINGWVSVLMGALGIVDVMLGTGKP